MGAVHTLLLASRTTRVNVVAPNMNKLCSVPKSRRPPLNNTTGTKVIRAASPMA